MVNYRNNSAKPVAPSERTYGAPSHRGRTARRRGSCPPWAGSRCSCQRDERMNDWMRSAAPGSTCHSAPLTRPPRQQMIILLDRREHLRRKPDRPPSPPRPGTARDAATRTMRAPSSRMTNHHSIARQLYCDSTRLAHARLNFQASPDRAASGMNFGARICWGWRRRHVMPWRG